MRDKKSDCQLITHEMAWTRGTVIDTEGSTCLGGASLLSPVPMLVTRMNFFTPFLTAASMMLMLPCGSKEVVAALHGGAAQAGLLAQKAAVMQGQPALGDRAGCAHWAKTKDDGFQKP